MKEVCRRSRHRFQSWRRRYDIGEIRSGAPSPFTPVFLLVTPTSVCFVFGKICRGDVLRPFSGPSASTALFSRTRSARSVTEVR